MEINEIKQIAEEVANKLKYLDFTKEELDKILKNLEIELDSNEMEELLTELKEKGYSYEEDFEGYDYDKSESAIDDTIYDESGTIPLKYKKFDDGVVKSGTFSKEELIKHEVEEVIKLLKANNVKCSYDIVNTCVKQAFESNPSLYELVKSVSINDIRKVQNILYDKVLAYQSYLVSLVGVKSADAKLNDLSSSLQAKPTEKETQQKFDKFYPEADVIEEQVKEQDASNTLATAAINMAMEELGKNASLEDIKNRSLEILKEQKDLKTRKL